MQITTTSTGSAILDKVTAGGLLSRNKSFPKGSKGLKVRGGEIIGGETQGRLTRWIWRWGISSATVEVCQICKYEVDLRGKADEDPGRCWRHGSFTNPSISSRLEVRDAIPFQTRSLLPHQLIVLDSSYSFLRKPQVFKNAFHSFTHGRQRVLWTRLNYISAGRRSTRPSGWLEYEQAIQFLSPHHWVGSLYHVDRPWCQ